MESKLIIIKEKDTFNEIEVFCPATIANVSCGFDVLGLCLDNVGDVMIARKVRQKGLTISKITGIEGLPLDIRKNVAGVSALALLERVSIDFGIELEIHKKIKAASGIGSSAASSAGATVAINKLLGEPFSKEKLVMFASKGEKASCGVEHADNVAPAIFGGFILVKSTVSPLQIIQLPTPSELMVSVVHPKIELKTSDARAVLKHKVTLQKAIEQWGNLASFVSALYTNNYDLLASSMKDVIIEPIRSILIPYYHKVKDAAITNGALGSSISGSGPSIFALSRGEKTAQKVLDAMSEIYIQKGLCFEAHLSKIATTGVKTIRVK